MDNHTIFMEKEKFLHMLEVQDELNKLTIGPDWKTYPSGTYVNQTKVRFLLAYKMEIMELIDSLPWKWWKEGTVDKDNILIEAVDALHFMLSIILLLKEHNAGYEKDFEDKLVLFIPKINRFYRESTTYLDKSTEEEQLQHHVSALITRCELALNTNLTEKVYNNSIVTAADITHPLYEIFTVLDTAFGIDLNAIYNTYLSKASLNRLRLKHGYKEGTYKKTWPPHGEEDNKILLELMNKCLEENNGMLNNLYDMLETAYKRSHTNKGSYATRLKLEEEYQRKRSIRLPDE